MSAGGRANPLGIAKCEGHSASSLESRSDPELDRLYRSHSASLLHQLTLSTGCPELARELAHEAFVRLLRMSPESRSGIEHPLAYLRRISSNLVRDWGRSRALSNRQVADYVPDCQVDQVAVLESRDTLRRLETALAKMKPRTREVFLAQRIEGLSYAAIADRTGLSVKGVEKQMSKAIAKIDRLLDRA